MQVLCFLCNSRFFVGEDDYVCSKPVCSYCMPYVQVCAMCAKLMKAKYKVKTDYGICNECRRISGNNFTSKWLILRYQTFRKDNFTCRYCGRSPLQDTSVKLHADHIIPRAKGGLDVLDNLVASCAECNQGKVDILLTEHQKRAVKNRVVTVTAYEPPNADSTDSGD